MSKVDVVKLHERREKKLKAIARYKTKLSKFKKIVDELDKRILENCDHPKEYQKLMDFDDTPENQGIWMCKCCNQVLRTSDYKPVDPEYEKEILRAQMEMLNRMGISYELINNREHSSGEDDPKPDDLPDSGELRS